MSKIKGGFRRVGGGGWMWRFVQNRVLLVFWELSENKFVYLKSINKNFKIFENPPPPPENPRLPLI